MSPRRLSGIGVAARLLWAVAVTAGVYYLAKLFGFVPSRPTIYFVISLLFNPLVWVALVLVVVAWAAAIHAACRFFAVRRRGG